MGVSIVIARAQQGSAYKAYRFCPLTCVSGCCMVIRIVRFASQQDAVMLYVSTRGELGLPSSWWGHPSPAHMYQVVAALDQTKLYARPRMAQCRERLQMQLAKTLQEQQVCLDMHMCSPGEVFHS
jgi:hypothetical protein